MKKRSIGLMILFSIITFGIYSLYWYIAFQCDLKRESGEGFGGVGHFFATIFTFGIYSLYWQYAAGRRLAKLGASDNSVLYLVLGLFRFSWINALLMQSAANNL